MQVRDERDAAVIQQSQMQTELSSCEKRIAGLEREIESVLGENMYMYLMKLRDRRLYELLNNSSSESKDEAKLIQLQSENQQLKEVIVKLYSKSEQDRQSLEKEVQELSTRLHSIENGERSELSQLCAQYRTEIDSLKVIFV